MAKFFPVSRSRWIWILVLGFCLAFPTDRSAAAPIESLKLKVKVVEVTRTGDVIRVEPSRVRVKRKAEVVVWVTNGESLKIAFKAKNPLPDLVCSGRFCGSLVPPIVEPGLFAYKVTVDGKVLDPQVEVVP